MITLSSIRSKKDNRILIIKNIQTKNEFVSKNIYSETSGIFETNETKNHCLWRLNLKNGMQRQIMQKYYGSPKYLTTVSTSFFRKICLVFT